MSIVSGPSPLQVERAICRQAQVERASRGAARRRAVAALVNELHAEQLKLHQDKARQKAALCTRQAGKTFWCVAEMLITALTKPRSLILYINESRKECLRVVWNNQEAKGLFPMIERCLEPEGFTVGPGGSGCDIEYNKTDLTLFFTGSKARIELVGADDERGINKLRGPAYDLIIVDESQKAPHLRKLVNETLLPGTMAKLGVITLIGTPGPVPAGMFYEVTREDHESLQGWSVHRFSLEDNVHLPDRFSIIEDVKTTNGWTDDSPGLLREYYGRWVADTSLLVYKLAGVPRSRRYYEHNLDPRHDWRYLIGVDIGFEPKPWAYVVWAYCEDFDVLFEVESASMAGLNTEAQAKLLIEMVDHYYPERLVCDAQGGGLKQIVEGDYVQRWGLPAEPATKTDKNAAIKAFNADLEAGRIKLIQGSPLDREMLVLPWFAPDGQIHPTRRPVEDPKFANHCCDAALYSYRVSTFYLTDLRTPRDNSEAAHQERKIQRHQERLRAQAQRRADPSNRDHLVDERWEDDDFDIIDEGGATSYYQQWGNR